MFGILDEHSNPVCCGFFISESIALTVEHDQHPAVGDQLVGRTYAVSGIIERTFEVVRVQKELDLVTLRLTIGSPPPNHWLTVPTSIDDWKLPVDGGLLALTLALGAQREAGDTWGPSITVKSVKVDMFTRERDRVHYYATFGPDDSGSPLVTWTEGGPIKVLAVAIHHDGLNALPPTAKMAVKIAETSPTHFDATPKPRQRRRRQSDAVEAVKDTISEVSDADSFMYDHIVTNSCTGGYGLVLSSHVVPSVTTTIPQKKNLVVSSL